MDLLYCSAVSSLAGKFGHSVYEFCDDHQAPVVADIHSHPCFFLGRQAFTLGSFLVVPRGHVDGQTRKNINSTVSQQAVANTSCALMFVF